MNSIPTFSADGRRIRNYSLASISAMLDAGKVAVERNRKGQIVQATLRPATGGNPILSSVHMGQYYSYQQHLPSGHQVWAHTPLLEKSVEPMTEKEVAAAEQFVHKIFLRVPLSVTVTPRKNKVVNIGEYRNRTKRLAPVISIDAFRPRRSMPAKPVSIARRPIEFDSERRAS